MLSFIKKLFAPKADDTANLEWFFEHPSCHDIDGGFLGHRFFTPVAASFDQLRDCISSGNYAVASRPCRQKATGRDGTLQVWAKTPAKAQEVLNLLDDQAIASQAELVKVVDCLNCLGYGQGCYRCDW